jgi:hypothetical protein
MLCNYKRDLPIPKVTVKYHFSLLSEHHFDSGQTGLLSEKCVAQK